MREFTKAVVVAALSTALVTGSAWVARRVSAKANRSSQALERIAAALERAYPPPKALPPPDAFDIGAHTGYWQSRDGVWSQIAEPEVFDKARNQTEVEETLDRKRSADAQYGFFYTNGSETTCSTSAAEACSQ